MTTSFPTTSDRRAALERGTDSRPPGRRAGYVVSALISLAGLWIVNHLLSWGWPPFLTPAFSDLLPYIVASMVATIVVNLVWAVRDPAWFRRVAQIGLNLVAIVGTVQTWRIYPFDFSGYAPVWDMLARLLIGISLLGLIVASVVELIGLGRPSIGTDDRR